jgi:type IV fimbrial biogenesis protein FimT
MTIYPLYNYFYLQDNVSLKKRGYNLTMKKTNGFTLVELMITIVIAALLLTVAVPSFRSSIENNKVIAQTNEVVSAHNLARMEAIKRGVPVTVCTSTNGIACSASTNWKNGWMVFSDMNGNGVHNGTDCNSAADDCILKVWGALSAGTNFTNATAAVTYSADGRKQGAFANVFSLSVTPVHCSGNRQKTIRIISTGRPEVTQVACP